MRTVYYEAVQYNFVKYDEAEDYMEEIQECFPQDFIQLFVNIEHGSWLNLVEHSEKIPSLEVSAEKYILHKEDFYFAWAKLGWSTADDRHMCLQFVFAL